MSKGSIIIITREEPLKDEATKWVQLLKSGIEKIHIRKPGLTTDELLTLIGNVPADLRRHLVIHYDIDAAIKAGAGGVHLPYRQLNSTSIPPDFSISASVHSWEEADAAVNLCNYCFISPVFDSISKLNYTANAQLNIVPEHLKQHKIYCLGGVHENNLQQALDRGYHGAAVLGYIWENETEAIDKARRLLAITEGGAVYE